MTEWPPASEWGTGDESETIARLIELTSKVNPEALICAYWCFFAVAPPELISDATHGSIPGKVSLAAFHTMRTEPAVTDPGFELDTYLKFTEELESLHLQYLFYIRPPHDPKPIDWIALKIAMQAEYVSGSAFPEQTENEIRQIQGRFDSWFESRVGINPNCVCDILKGITRCLEANVNRLRKDAKDYSEKLAGEWQLRKHEAPFRRFKTKGEAKRVTFQYYYTTRAPVEVPVGFEQISNNLDGGLSKKTWETFLNLFGADTAYISSCKAPNEMKIRPVLIFWDGRVILADISNAMDVAWNIFDAASRHDMRFYDKRYIPHRSAWLESFAASCFQDCFPPECVFNNLHYPNPDDPDGSNAELDILISWGPFIILCECKAKQFRFESNPGDLGRFRTDIKANIEDAFDQAARARRYLNGAEEAIFTENESGRTLSLNRESIDRIYLVTVAQHHLAGFAARLASLEEIGLFADKEYPAAFCAADLELVCHFSRCPEVFLHYIEQRKNLVDAGFDIHGDDLDLFGAYLSSRLVLTDIEPDITPEHRLYFSGYSDQFDKWYSYKRGELSTPPKIEIQLPGLIPRLLQELRNRNESGSKYISFALLGLPNIELRALCEGFEQIQKLTLSPGLTRRITHVSENCVFCLLKFPEQNSSEIDRHTHLRTVSEKYRLKKSFGIGFGVGTQSHRIFDCGVWVEGEWEVDEELEKLVADSPLSLPAPGQALPGRNDPCLCGSGKKYKHCCKPKIDDARRS